MRTAAAWLCVMSAAWVVSPAMAEDESPPDWRGDAGSTTQEWDFLDGASPSHNYFSPDGTSGINSNPYGDGPPLAQAEGTYDGDGGPNSDGAWEDYTIDFFIENKVELDESSWKDLRVQATYSGTAPSISITSVGSISWQSVGSSTIDLGDGWSLL
ncbi:hypothetical protein LCGC14_2025110, partial [marine sediment metagenome]